MKRFKNILYCPSAETHDPAALSRVVDLASRNEADLTLFGVIPEPNRLQRLLDRPSVIEEVQVAARKELFDILIGLTAHVDARQIETIVEIGRPNVAIIERVLTAGHDLVVINNVRFPHPPIVKRLLRKCPCPVWVMRPSQRTAQRVLAVVNPHPDEDDLNRMILELASSMVERYGGDLHVGHAWDPYGDEPENPIFNFTPAVGYEQLRAEAEAASQRAIDELLASASLADAPWHIHLRRGPADYVIRQLVKEHRIDLLVMGTVARSGRDGVVIGNTAERVLDEVRCSVMAVKPPGFVSPIRVPASEQ